MELDNKNHLQEMERVWGVANFVAKVTGMYIPRKGTPIYQKIFRYSFNFFVLFLNAQGAVTMLLQMILHSDDGFIPTAARMVSTLLYVITTFHTAFFMSRGGTVNKIREYAIKTLRYESLTGYDVINMDMVFRKIFLVMFSFGMFLLIGMEYWNIDPLLFKSKNGTRALPLDCWYPIDVQTSPNYELIYIWEALTQTFQGISHCGIESFYLTGTIVAIRQFEILQHSLRNIVFTAMVRAGMKQEDVKRFAINFNKYGMEKNGDFDFLKTKEDIKHILNKDNVMVDSQTVSEFKSENEDFFIGRYEKELKLLMGECVQHHNDILYFCARVNSITSPIYCVKTSYRTVFLCFVMFMLATAPNMTILDYLALDMGELFLLAIFGTALEVASVNTRNALYDCPWYLCSTSFRKSTAIMLHRSELPVVMTAGFFFNLNYETCVRVIQAAFSYFTFIRNFSPVEEG